MEDLWYALWKLTTYLCFWRILLNLLLFDWLWLSPNHDRTLYKPNDRQSNISMISGCHVLLLDCYAILSCPRERKGNDVSLLSHSQRFCKSKNKLITSKICVKYRLPLQYRLQMTSWRASQFWYHRLPKDP